MTTVDEKIKVMVMCRYHYGKPAPFITDQIAALEQCGCTATLFNTEGDGIMGYVKAYFRMRTAIKSVRPDIIHAHYGMTGLLANFQRRVPVVTTYHGSDINLSKVRKLSQMSMRLSAFNIFVSRKNVEQAGAKSKYELIPCGVDTSVFCKMDKAEARAKMNLPMDGKFVLFAGAFDVSIKNADLAKAAMANVENATLIELKGYSREEVAVLLSAVDCMLMTSKSEGSPQIVKEAIATGCPIVSVDVGDVKERINGLNNCVIADRNPQSIAEAMKSVIDNGQRIESGEEKIKAEGLDNEGVARKIVSIYKKVIGK